MTRQMQCEPLPASVFFVDEGWAFPVPANECVFMGEETDGIRVEPKLGIGFCHVPTADGWVIKPFFDGTLIVGARLQGEWAEQAATLRKWCVQRWGGLLSRPPQSGSMRVLK